jgi:hypothetical protein
MDRPCAIELLVESRQRIAELRRICEESRRLCAELMEERARNQDARATLRRELSGIVSTRPIPVFI